MFAEIITIGDEILIGQITDTNSAWLGQELNSLGVEISQIRSISDKASAITKALDSLEPETRIVIITGGLGPTKDDITKETLAEYFGGGMAMNQDLLEHIHFIFKKIGREVNKLNESQAIVPTACVPLKNFKGTAAGMRFQKDGITYFSLPGVPYEMKDLFERYIAPYIKESLNPEDQIIHKTLLTVGVPESILAQQIESWEGNLPSQLKLAYLPSAGTVRLRLTARGKVGDQLEALINREFDKVRALLGDIVFGEDHEKLEELVGKQLLERGETLSLAESCTGGYLAHLLTSIPGSSAYFMGSVVAYDYEAKINQLGVYREDLMVYGAVSGEIVHQMAEGVRRVLKTDYALSASGVAGPGGGTPEKPVGTVWIGLSSKRGTQAFKFQLGTDRMRNIRKTALLALDLLRKEIKAVAAGEE